MRRGLGRLARAAHVALVMFGTLACWGLTRAVGAESNTGFLAKVYELIDSSPQRSDSTYSLCSGAWTTVETLEINFGSGPVAGCRDDYVLVHLAGSVQLQQAGPQVQRSMSFTANNDDGFWFSMNGKVVYDVWYYSGHEELGSFGHLVTNQKYPVDLWFYDITGPSKLGLRFSIDDGAPTVFADGASCGTGCTLELTTDSVSVGPTAPSTSTTTTTTTSTTTTTTTSTTTTTTTIPRTTLPSPTTTRPPRPPSTVEPAATAPTTTAPKPIATSTTSTTPSTLPVDATVEDPEPELIANPLAGGDPVRLITLTAALDVGEPAAGRMATSTATGLAPGSVVTLTMHSDPVVLGTGSVDDTGTVTLDAPLPPSIESGLHMLVLTGTMENGEPVSSTVGFTVADDGTVGAVSPASESASHSLPSVDELERALESGLSLYDPDANAASVAALGAAAAVAASAAAGVLAGGGGGGASGRSGGGSGAGSRSGRSVSQVDLSGIELADIGDLDTNRVGRGDRSRLWRAPGGRQWAQLMKRACTWAQSRSTLVARSLSDGESFRAMFGSVDAVVCLTGVALGLVGALSVEWLAVAPATGWVVAIVALSMLNALAGFGAAVSFVVPVMLAGNAFTVFDARTLLGLVVLFIAPPLLANSIRPLRRDPAHGWYWFDRAADYLIVPLFLGFSVSSVYSSLNGLSGLEMVGGSETELLKISVIVCAVVRLLIEDLTARHFPRRLAEVNIGAEESPGVMNRLFVLAMRGFVYLSIAAPFFGLGWQTWTMLCLTLTVPFIKIVFPDPPNVTILHRWFPRGILRTVIMMFVASWLAAKLFGDGSDPERIRAMTVWMLLPGVIIAFIDLLAREGGGWPESLWKRLAGGGLWAYSALVLLGFIRP